MSVNPATIQFINEKSPRRVVTLVDELRNSFEAVKPQIVEEKANKVLDKVNEEPLYSLSDPTIMHYPIKGEAIPLRKSPIQTLKQYAYYFPPTLPEECAYSKNDDLSLQKKELLIEARQEHHRLLWAFQDRLTIDAMTQDGDAPCSPFKTAAALLVREADNPVTEGETTDVKNTQIKTNSVLRKSQNATGEVLENQMKLARMIQDREQFRANNMNDGKPPKKANEIPISIPFQFLCDNDTSK